MQVKAAVTRAYKKEKHLLPYDAFGAGGAGKKRRGADGNGLASGGGAVFDADGNPLGGEVVVDEEEKDDEDESQRPPPAKVPSISGSD